VTPAQRERCFGLLCSGADLWAAVLELNALRRRRGHALIVTYQDLCRELTRAEPGIAGSAPKGVKVGGGSTSNGPVDTAGSSPGLGAPCLVALAVGRRGPRRTGGYSLCLFVPKPLSEG